MVYAGDYERQATILSAILPLSTSSQKSDVINDGWTVAHCEAPALARVSERSAEHASIASAYRLSNLAAIASRTRTAAGGTFPALTPTVSEPAR